MAERIISLLTFFMEESTLIEYDDYSITVEMHDVNLEVGDRTWEEYIREIFTDTDTEVKFTYGDGNIVTVNLSDGDEYDS